MTARLICCLLIATAPAFAQDHAKPSTPPNTAVTVKGEDGKTQSFDAAALAKLPQHEVRAEAHGNAVTCEGPTLSDVLAHVGAPQGETLRGKALSLYAKVSGRDDYRVVYSLAELDPAMHADVPILTTKCNGAKLDDSEGPFRVIYPGEKRPARWIRQVNAIELLRAP
ncbi:MAG TPA: molybdopterin-dependent oxidoreductase [Rudaea sp.]|jgi:hypothetical protein|nr:molybdopterin-dependent oxidoreductase [Rudaea sp.]